MRYGLLHPFPSTRSQTPLNSLLSFFLSPFPLPFSICKVRFCPSAFAWISPSLEFSDSFLPINPLHPPPTSTHSTTLKNPLTSNYTPLPQGSIPNVHARPGHPGPCFHIASSFLCSTCHNGYYSTVCLVICLISPLSCKP